MRVRGNLFGVEGQSESKGHMFEGQLRSGSVNEGVEVDGNYVIHILHQCLQSVKYNLLYDTSIPTCYLVMTVLYIPGTGGSL